MIIMGSVLLISSDYFRFLSISTIVRIVWNRKFGKDSTSKFKIMKRETWKMIVLILISILTALWTTLRVTSCM